MMLSDVDGVTPSSDLLEERAAAFDVLSIWIPTSTPVTQITYDAGYARVPYDSSRTAKRHS
jgi:hypothetical protein